MYLQKQPAKSCFEFVLIPRRYGYRTFWDQSYFLLSFGRTRGSIISIVGEEIKNRVVSLHKRKSHGHIAPLSMVFFGAAGKNVTLRAVHWLQGGERAEMRWESHFHQQPSHTHWSVLTSHTHTHRAGLTLSGPYLCRIYSRRNV